jgi:glycosyltransferase involved in cell wall biosynthesis
MTQKSIVYLGYSSFPYGLAEVQKIIMISKSFILTDNNAKVICRNGTHSKFQYPALKSKGEFDGIRYVYASGSCYRSNNFFMRRVYEAKGKVNEFLTLCKMKRNKRLDYAILSTRKFSSVLYYVILSKILGFKTILNYVEYYSAFKKRKSQYRKRLNDKLFDQYAPRIVNAVFPISEFLIKHISVIAPGKKYLKIPVLTNFDKYDNIEVLQDESYFLFCGDAGYKEIIFFIIDSFCLLKTTNPYYLYLVVNGKKESLEQIEKYASEQRIAKMIKIFSSLGENKLYGLYKGAKALLIPLRPTLQDAARFPHKTGEYLASGNPVISTNYGEIKFYFRDGDNMLLAGKYDKNLFAEKMQFVIDNPNEARAIGSRGRELARELFDYKNVAPDISKFLLSLS